MNRVLCFALALLAVVSSCSAKPNFMFISPKIYDVGSTATVVLNLFDVTGNGRFLIWMVKENTDLLTVPVEIEDGKGTTVEIRVPSLPRTISYGKLQISGRIGNYTIDQTGDIAFRRAKPAVFVNTDKPLYKADQTVKIRVLVTDKNLRPVKTAKAGEIWITDPNRIRIAQWLNVSFGEGLLHRELILPKEPSLGVWAVHVKINNNDVHKRTFEVQEYVLPPFEVTITPPPYVLKNATNITWKVCAKYTYGKPARGKLLATFRCVRSLYYWSSEIPPIDEISEIDGCQDVTFRITEMRNRIYIKGYQLDAEVIEEGTGTKINSSRIVYPSDYVYTITRLDSHIQYFRPRIPLRITMEIKTPDSKPLPGELVTVCVEVKSQRKNEIRTITDKLNICKNYTSGHDGRVIFTIPPQDPNTESIKVEVRAANPHLFSNSGMNAPSHTFQLKPWYTPSGNHLQIERLDKVHCSSFDSDVRAKQAFRYTFDEPGTKQIFYQIMARGKIVAAGDFNIELKVNDDENATDDTYLSHYLSATSICGCSCEREVNSPKYIGKFVFPVEFTHEMMPKLHLLLYTLTDDGDVIADSTWYDVDRCFPNKVSISFGEKIQSPGSRADIHLRAESKSLCSVGVVDKSVYVLNKGDRLTQSKINDKLKELEKTHHSLSSQKTSDYQYCSQKNVPYPSTADHVADVVTAFETEHLLVLTDLELETRPCKKLEVEPYNRCPYPGPPGYPGRPKVVASGISVESMEANMKGDVHYSMMRPSSPEYTVSTAQEPTSVVTDRKDFPETWLFDLYTVGDEGKLLIQQNMPDSITEWQGEAVCVHADKGLGLSNPASVTAFQPFFASVTLPYSVIRNETVPVIVSVFNYLKTCLPIEINLDKTEDFHLFNGSLTKDVCVCGERSVTERFHIKPSKLGRTNVTVTAATSKKFEVCGNSLIATNVKRSDTITKYVLVEAEGFLKEEVTNTFFCMKDIEEDTFSTEHPLQLPADVIKDSARAFCFLTGDLMGPTLEGLDRLIRLPTGCGEQNMIGLVPNIVVLQYLNATGRLSEKLKQEAVNNIKQGYIREQNYRHPDGSYSAFGTRDKEGSIWLTAFVVRTFASARHFISIDEHSLVMSRNWILSKQRESGCFPMIGTVHHQEMKGGLAKSDKTTSALTAYILISMLESGRMGSFNVSSALRCLEANDQPTNYSLALFAYAACLAKDSSSSHYIQRLLDNAEKESSFMYWNDSDKSISIETAGYAILSLLRLDREGDFANAAKIAQWLTKQRNPYGGFTSTQDTVVALQALGEYGARVTRQELNMELSIQLEELEKTLQLNKNNELLTQRLNLRLSKPQSEVYITASGNGCALIQTLLRYNIPTPEPRKDFELSVQTEKSKHDCKKAEIRICVSYNHPNESNMAIVEVRMVSGYSPSKATLSKLLNKTELKIRRYEITENSVVNIYFTALTEETICFHFDVIQEIEILDAKPAIAKVYDYYNSDKSESVSYTIEEQCAL